MSEKIAGHESHGRRVVDGFERWGGGGKQSTPTTWGAWLDAWASAAAKGKKGEIRLCFREEEEVTAVR